MEKEGTFIAPLLEKAEAYGKTNIELLKLRTVETGADLASGFLSQALIWTSVLFFKLSAGVAAALWLGERWGKNYLGFAAVAAMYAFCSLLFFLFRRPLKSMLNNSMIRQLSERVWKK